MIPAHIKNFYIPDVTKEPRGAGSFYEFLIGLGEGQMAAIEAVRLYDLCYPMANAIDKRAEAFANLPLKVFDKKAGKFLEQGHDVIALLDTPNPNDTREAFMTALACFFDITGNSFVTGTYDGRINRPPLEMFVRAPTQISILPSKESGTAGFAGEYLITPPHSGQESYKLDDSGRRFRWIGKDRFGDPVRELTHLRRFNAGSGTSCALWGVSRAKALMLEIQQYVEGNKTNYSSLRNGIRPSGAFVGNTGTELTDAQWQRVQELAREYKGATGAGKVFAADGVDFKPMNLTNRDMEYRDLQKDMEIRINQRYNIPLPLLNEKTTTYNNMATAEYAFYHDAVLPLADVILGALTQWLMPKYKGGENLLITYDPAEIGALRLRNFEEAKVLRDVQANTDNELRTLIGYPNLGEGGDVVFKPANQLPADSLVQYSDQIRAANDGLKSSGYARFIKALLLSVNKDTGKPYTEAEAIAEAKRYGIH